MGVTECQPISEKSPGIVTHVESLRGISKFSAVSDGGHRISRGALVDLAGLAVPQRRPAAKRRTLPCMVNFRNTTRKGRGEVLFASNTSTYYSTSFLSNLCKISYIFLKCAANFCNVHWLPPLIWKNTIERLTCSKYLDIRTKTLQIL